jgi:hypothetical protein
MSAFKKGFKEVNRFDSTLVFHALEEANHFIREVPSFYSFDYNTAIKTDIGWVVTNKFDPRCVDKVSPVKAGYRKETENAI